MKLKLDRRMKKFFDAAEYLFDEADIEGEAAILETFKSAFKECKKDYKLLTILSNMMFNREWYFWDKWDEEQDEEYKEQYRTLAKVYHKLWLKVQLWGKHNLEDEELEFFRTYAAHN